MISRKFSARVLMTQNERVDVSVDVALVYDEDYDPLAVKMVFSAPEEEDVEWTLSRELMLRGSSSAFPYGSGDVKFRYLGERDGGLMLCLNNGGGHADIRLPQYEVVRFLEETCEAVPFGSEDIEDSVDDLIKELLT